MKRLILVFCVWLSFCCALLGSSNEIRISYASADVDQILYAIIFKVSDGEVFDEADGGNAFEVYDPLNIANYNIPMTHYGGDFYMLTFDTSITDADTYHVVVYDQMAAGDSPAVADDIPIGDDEIRWSGTAELPPAVDITHINGDSAADNTATLALEHLDIQNAAGNAITAYGGGSGHGADIKGGATGDGILATGGSTSGAGASFVAGVTTGNGLEAIGTAGGNGIHAQGGSGAGSGIYALGSGSGGHGLRAKGGDVGNGINAIGGDDEAAGIYAAAFANDDAGMELVGNGTGRDLDADETNTLYDDWIDGGRLDNILDAINASSATVVALTTTVTAGDARTFIIAAGVRNDDAYNNMVIAVTDAKTGFTELRRISDYVGTSRTITIERPFSFTPAAADVVTIAGVSVAPASGGWF